MSANNTFSGVRSWGVSRKVLAVAAGWVAVVLGGAAVGHAQTTYTWLGGGADNGWNTSFNWDTFSVPPTSSPPVTSIIDSTLPGVATSVSENPPDIRDGGRLNLQLSGGTLNINTATWRYGYENNGTPTNLITVGGGTVAANLNRNSNGSSGNMFGGASFLMGVRGSAEQAIRVLANGAVKVRVASASLSPFNDTVVGPTFSNNQEANARISLEAGRWDNGSKILALGYNQNTQKGFFDFTGGELANVSTYLGISRIPGDYPLSGVNWNLVDYSTQTTLLQQGGTIKPGTVTYPGNAFANAVENPIGLMTIYGNLTQQALGGIAIDIAGTSPSQYDRLSVVAATAVSGGGTAGGGIVSLAGLLQINPINGFISQPGDTFDILTAATSIDVTGLTISDPGYTFQVVGGNTLQVQAVPEPSTLGIAGAAALALGVLGRRVRRRAA